MIRCFIVAFLLCFLVLFNSSLIEASQISGNIGFEGRIFTYDPLYQEQRHDNVSISSQPEYYHQFKNGSSFTFTPFARLDYSNPNRTHVDVRELNYLWLNDSWELRLGISRVFWGVTESQHLVDIINQTDFVEAIDGEDKLGQPMVYLSVPKDWGIIDLFIMPYFRERTYPGVKGRIRSPYPVDTKQSVYKTTNKENHIDAAIRYSKTIGDWDIGISNFRGISRDPTLVLGTSNYNDLVWIPHYDVINQTGLDVQYVTGMWLWKLESIYRVVQGKENYFALTGGYEYTFTGVTKSGLDIGFLGEWLYDDRGSDAPSGNDNDLMLGVRFSFNDAASSQILISLIEDLNSDGSTIAIEASRRLNNNWKLNIEALFLVDSSSADPYYTIQKDDYILVGLSYYF